MISENQNVPDLDPLNFTGEEIATAVKNHRMLALQAHLPAVCNYHCYYCYTKEFFKKKEFHIKKEQPELYKSFIRQGIELGARTISFPGLGEPFMVPWFFDLLDFCRNMGIEVVVFTNGSLTEEQIELLFEYKPALYVKLNSLRNPEIMNKMSGDPNSWTRSFNLINYLLENNYNNGHNLIGIESVVVKDNINEIVDLYKWSRENSIIPLIELPMPFEGDELLDNVYISPEEGLELFGKLSEIDAGYGIFWTPHPPFAGSGCSFHLISLIMYPDGSIHPCSGIFLEQPYGNIKKDSLSKIWNSERVINRIEAVHKIKQRDICNNYGCRAYAYRKYKDLTMEDNRFYVKECKLINA